MRGGALLWPAAVRSLSSSTDHCANAVQCSTVQYSAVQCSTVQYNAVQCSTVQYYAVQCSTMHYKYHYHLCQLTLVSSARRYLVWKHYTLLHLDYIGALFAVMYLLALLRRMINEPTTLFYLLYVLLKCMPLAPLILGFREPFLRWDPRVSYR